MNNKKLRKIFIFIFALYMMVLILVLVFKYPTGMLNGTLKNILAGKSVVRLKPKLVPFQMIVEYIKQAHAINDWFVKNLACNIVMFIPYGFLIPCFSKHKGRKLILSGCVLSVMIEILQYITALGQMDIDDVILNTLGVTLGYMGYLLLNFLLRKIHDK